jgi:phosphohistidine phosphatase SixA
MIALLMLRHAHAGDPMRWSGDDADRPLSDKGRRQAERLGHLLAGIEEPPDLFITSPKVRADETARIVADALGVPVVVDPRLAGGILDPDTVEDILLAAGPAARPCLVGHDPAFSELLGELVGIPSLAMRKGALARVDLPGPRPAAGRGTLRYLLPPDVVPSR